LTYNTVHFTQKQYDNPAHVGVFGAKGRNRTLVVIHKEQDEFKRSVSDLTKRLTFSPLRLMLELIFTPFLLGVGCNFQHDGGKALSTSELETHLVTPHDNITLWHPSLSGLLAKN
jgi:hypothetical protein